MQNVERIGPRGWGTYGVNACGPRHFGAVVRSLKVGRFPNLRAFDGGVGQFAENCGCDVVANGQGLGGFCEISAGVCDNERADQIVVVVATLEHGVKACGDFVGGTVVVGHRIFEHGILVAAVGFVGRDESEVGDVAVGDRDRLNFQNGVAAQVRGQKPPLQDVFLRAICGRQRVKNGNGNVFLFCAVVCGSGRRVNEAASARQHHVVRHLKHGRSVVSHEHRLLTCRGVSAKVRCRKRSIHRVFSRAVALHCRGFTFGDWKDAVAGVCGEGRCVSWSFAAAEGRVGRGSQGRGHLVDDLHGLNVG